MEQLVRFEQFYYTNYGQGMRFEGDSTGDRQTEKDIELLADNWMKLDVQKSVETIAYNARLGCYVAAMVRPCTKAGDARVSYWIHGVIPKAFESDGFRECLSWPLSKYQQEVTEGAELSMASEPAVDRHLPDICRRYGLTGERLVHFAYMVWQTVCGQDKPSTLYFILDQASLNDYNAAARDVMALVYDLLPESLRQQADYQAYAAEDIRNTRFVFKAASESSWRFNLDAAGDGSDLEMPEEERTVMALLAGLYETDAKKYAKVIQGLYHDAAAFEDFVWNYYLNCMKRGDTLSLSQETLIRCLPRLEQQAEAHKDYRRLLCQCLSGIDTNGKPVNFVQTVMEKYILAAAGLPQTDCREYEESFEHIWKLLDRLRAGSMSTIQSYLEWIRKVSPSYYQNFVRAGLAGNRMYLLKILGSADVGTPKELFRWMKDLAFLKNVIAYRDFVADKAEEFYFLETTTDEERQVLLGYCRDQRGIQLQELRRMSYGELLSLNSESMDRETQELWLQTAAARIREDQECLSSAEQAEKLYEYVLNLKCVQEQVAAGIAKAQKNKKVKAVEAVPIDTESMNVIINAMWRFEGELSAVSRFRICMLGKFAGGLDFEQMTEAFWAGIGDEDFEVLFKHSPVSMLFKGSYNQQYMNYRLYLGYKRKKDEKFFKSCTERLTGSAEPAINAIWRDWTQHQEADSQWMCEVMRYLMEEDALQMLLRDYAARGPQEAERLAEILGEDVSPEDIQAEDVPPEDGDAFGGRLSWIVSAGIGLFMGLIVNGWYMAVHLSKLLAQPMLVWAGVAGIAVVIALFMAFADKLVRADLKINAVQIPWAGLWLFVELVLTYFIGNKITAVISVVILLAAYIWLRLKKLL